MSQIAPFKPDRFTSTIPHYISGRPSYAPRLVERLAREAALSPASKVLDLGCGPGPLTILLARHAGHVVGMDVDPAMVAAARAEAQGAGATNIEWRIGSSFDLGDDLAPLDLVTIARAFHWMDRDATLRRFDELLSPSAPVALINTELHPSGPNRWHTVFEAVRRAHGQFDEFYHWRKGQNWEDHVSVLMRSPFSHVERFSVFDKRHPTLDQLVARALSFSANSPSILGDERRRAYEEELRERLLATSPEASFEEIVESVAIVARRPR
jgi:SAM-dependent methyltransferase